MSSSYHYAPGAIHLDHHKELSIDVKNADDALRIMSAYLNRSEAEDVTPAQEVVKSDETPDEELFKYIHVAVTDDNERLQIHKQVCNIVRLPKMKQICDELYLLIKKEKVLSTIKPDAMLVELRRVGMPPIDTPGFSDQNFYSNYRV